MRRPDIYLPRLNKACPNLSKWRESLGIRGRGPTDRQRSITPTSSGLTVIVADQRAVHEPAVMLCDLHRVALAQHDDRRGARSGRLDGLRRLAPAAIEQCGGCRYTSGRSSLRLLGDVDQCCNGQVCVLTGKRDDLRQSFRAPAGVAGFARPEQRACSMSPSTGRPSNSSAPDVRASARDEGVKRSATHSTFFEPLPSGGSLDFLSTAIAGLRFAWVSYPIQSYSAVLPVTPTRDCSNT